MHRQLDVVNADGAHMLQSHVTCHCHEWAAHKRSAATCKHGVCPGTCSRGAVEAADAPPAVTTGGAMCQRACSNTRQHEAPAVVRPQDSIGLTAMLQHNALQASNVVVQRAQGQAKFAGTSALTGPCS